MKLKTNGDQRLSKAKYQRSLEDQTLSTIGEIKKTADTKKIRMFDHLNWNVEVESSTDETSESQERHAEAPEYPV